MITIAVGIVGMASITAMAVAGAMASTAPRSLVRVRDRR